MTTVLETTTDALATFRLTKLVVDDEILKPIREKIFTKWEPTPDSWSYVLTCPWCSSIWLGAGVVAARTFAPRAWGLVSAALAFSAASGILAEKV